MVQLSRYLNHSQNLLTNQSTHLTNIETNRAIVNLLNIQIRRITHTITFFSLIYVRWNVYNYPLPFFVLMPLSNLTTLNPLLVQLSDNWNVTQNQIRAYSEIPQVFIPSRLQVPTTPCTIPDSGTGCGTDNSTDISSHCLIRLSAILSKEQGEVRS